MRNEDVYPYLTPFVPYYASKESKQGTVFEGKCIDYTHERGWRVAADFTFDYSDIEFVIVGKMSDLHELGDEVATAIGVDKFLFVDTYRQIEQL